MCGPLQLHNPWAGPTPGRLPIYAAAVGSNRGLSGHFAAEAWLLLLQNSVRDKGCTLAAEHHRDAKLAGELMWDVHYTYFMAAGVLRGTRLMLHVLVLYLEAWTVCPCDGGSGVPFKDVWLQLSITASSCTHAEH